MKRFYRKVGPETEWCFYVETTESLEVQELALLQQILAEGFLVETISAQSLIESPEVKTVEFGPRMNFATAFSTNLVSICHTCGLTKVTRIERSRRYSLPINADKRTFVAQNHDRMTECTYSEPLKTFETAVPPEPVYEIPLMEKGPAVLLEVPGLAMDERDRNFYHDYFVKQEGRNPTDVEMKDLNNTNSEHSRHGYFKGRQIIDGIVMPQTLMEIVKSTLSANPANSIIAFKDNSSGIKGYDCWTIVPEYPGQPSPFAERLVRYHIIFSAETHNFPTGIAPFPGAETGTGGRIRDIHATGQGGLYIAGTAGYCVANLLIPGYDLPWENAALPYPSNLAPSLEVEIRASDGASDYGNKFGEPLILGFTRAFDQVLPDGERWGWVKKIMFTGGIGQIDHCHTEKGEAVKGLLITQVGGPAYAIGIGGGAASSMLQGENEEELDFNAVQRGDAEMEQKLNRVIRACVEMGENNPIVSIHDQGAGGPANVLKELVEKAGGKIELRRIMLGDATLSVLKIWIAEYQERDGFLIHPSRINEFKEICRREKVNCEVLGEVTGNGRFVVHDEKDNSTPVDLDLSKVLGNIPQKTFEDRHLKPKLSPLKLPEGLTVKDALYRVLRDLAVGSKRFLTTNKVDRSVTGLIVRQQCCGPLQLTVSDMAVVSQSHFGLTGAATSIGEQPIKMLINPKAGARMAVGEALTNLIWAKISGLQDVKCSANWMWAAKLPGEGAALYDAAVAMRDIMVKLGFAVDGGKDSLSMATKVGDEIVKSPRELVISAYATVPDIRKVVTPDIKSPGESHLIFIPLSQKTRLGGSALAHVYCQIGNECPDVEDPDLLKRTFFVVQQLIADDLILAGHDVSDGGFITAALEMAFAGNCGAELVMRGPSSALERLFAEELGLIFESRTQDSEEILSRLRQADIPVELVGWTIAPNKRIFIQYNGEWVLDESMLELRDWWEETSYQIDRLQATSQCVNEERKNIYDRQTPEYFVAFTPKPTPPHIINSARKPDIAILREEGSNGDREMASAFHLAGFRVWDVTMTDLIEGRITLEKFRGLAAVGGFSYADVPESAKGWAATIRLNPKLKRMFDEFYNRPDTFSLGVCNGCQLFALLGWVPWSGIPDEKQPRFVKNTSGRFESRWVMARIYSSPSIMLLHMEGSILGIWVAHGEGKLYFPDPLVFNEATEQNLLPIAFVDDEGRTTEQYPFNPNGSPLGIAALCTPDGRHFAMMPHPERAFLKWQWPWLPKELDRELAASPWLQMFQNARTWCEKNV